MNRRQPGGGEAPPDQGGEVRGAASRVGGAGLLELDADFGTLLDLVAELGLADDTMVVFAGDDGPEEILTWRGSPGYREGSYFAGGEGNLHTPCIVRWPGHTAEGGASDEIMHVVDWFTTIIKAAGVEPSEDREIDGVDQGVGSPVTRTPQSVRATFTGWGRRCTG